MKKQFLKFGGSELLWGDKNRLRLEVINDQCCAMRAFETNCMSVEGRDIVSNPILLYNMSPNVHERKCIQPKDNAMAQQRMLYDR